MNRTLKLMTAVAAWPILLGACALPFVTPDASGTEGKPIGAFGPEAKTAANNLGLVFALLPDDRVLATGGSASRGSLDDAEVYEAQRNTWSVLPSMPEARNQHTATALLDGSVLVAGGTSATGDVLATAALFHANGTWTPTGPMSQPRWGHTALRLNDGRVLIIGGWARAYPGPGVAPDATVDLFDPATQRFTPVAPAPAVLWGTMFATLPDGRVLMAGGEDPTNGSNSKAWLYDPKTNVWSSARPMPGSRSYGVTATLANGKVLVAGGNQMQPQPAAQPPTPLSGAILYDPAHNSWSKIADAPTAISQGFGGAIVLRDGRALAFAVDFSGGAAGDVSAIFYDPATGTWSTGSPLSVTSSNGGTFPIVLQSGKVLVVLGSTSVLFDPERTAPGPPRAPVHPLASPQLTPWLLLAAALLVLILGAQYGQAQFRGRRRPDASPKGLAE
ncbi:MAG TPA: kelch repeat-containing protein [Candidatus Dormibacteraeota bacterium]|nr:kelch repeat-containing protein [Candidatus Dormibacteraeota bacterium]